MPSEGGEGGVVSGFLCWRVSGCLTPNLWTAQCGAGHSRRLFSSIPPRAVQRNLCPRANRAAGSLAAYEHAVIGRVALVDSVEWTQLPGNRQIRFGLEIDARGCRPRGSAGSWSTARATLLRIVCSWLKARGLAFHAECSHSCCLAAQWKRHEDRPAAQEAGNPPERRIKKCVHTKYEVSMNRRCASENSRLLTPMNAVPTGQLER
jgi:hypothetical protein